MSTKTTQHAQKVLIKYVYDVEQEKRPVAVLVATSPTNIGLAVCSSKDSFNKKLARHIALERANKTEWSLESFLNKEPSKFLERKITSTYDDAYISLKDEVLFHLEKMKERANRYFKSQSPTG